MPGKEIDWVLARRQVWAKYNLPTDVVELILEHLLRKYKVWVCNDVRSHVALSLNGVRLTSQWWWNQLGPNERIWMGKGWVRRGDINRLKYIKSAYTKNQRRIRGGF